MSSEVTILPCPFCDGEARVGMVRDGRIVICGDCEGHGPAAFHGRLDQPSAEQRAIAAWNTRQQAEARATSGAGEWRPQVGERVRVVGRYESDFYGTDLWVAGVEAAAIHGGGYHVTVAEQWPIPWRHSRDYKGQTDGFYVGVNGQDDSLAPLPAFPTEAPGSYQPDARVIINGEVAERKEDGSWQTLIPDGVNTKTVGSTRTDDATEAPGSEGAGDREVGRRWIISEARKTLRLVQSCMECNADDELRWSETIEWLEKLA